MEWAAKIAALSASERRKLEALMASGTQGLNVFPLSYTQEWVWWNARLKPGTSLYNAPMALRTEGPLHVDALDEAFQELVARHEVLRTSFHLLARTVVQAVEPAPPRFALPLDDLTALPEAEREQAAQRLAVEERSRPFVLTRGPLLRGRLLKLAADSHLLLLTTHHLVTDDWSMRVLLREIVTLYGALREGKPSPLAPLPLQYADFAVWQRDWLDDARMETEFAYWAQRLAGAPVPLDLPTDHPRPPGRSHRALVHWFDLPQELADQVRDLSRAVGVTPYMTLMAAFQLWLHRTTGHETFATSTLTAYRDRAEVADVIGDFGNLVAVPADLRGDELTFRELIPRVRDAVLETQEHADVPAHRLSVRLMKRREDSHNPISQAMFFSVHAQHSMSTLELPGLRLKQVQVAAERPATPFDVELRHFEQVQGMRMQLLCNADLFEEDSVAQLASRFVAVLGAAVEDPDGRLAGLDLSGALEAGPTAPGPGAPESPAAHTATPAPLADALRAHAAAHPDRPAVVTATTTVNYADLWALVAADPTPGTVVATVDALCGGPADPTPGQDAAALLAHWAEAIPLAPDDRFLRTAAPGTPTAALETLLPLAAGATLCTTPADGAGWDAAVRGATVAALPASRFAALAAGQDPLPDALRAVIATGAPDRLPDPAPGLLVVRAVGGTVRPPLPFAHLGSGHRGPLLGVPDRPAGAMLLDARGRRVPDGVEGQLCCVHPGDEAPHPTGLSARRLAGGRIEVVGRVGEHVERDGYRIRPSDIEWALTADPAVHAARVALLPDGRLTAHAEATETGADALTARIRSALSGFMTPDSVVVSDRLPATLDGRTDRAEAQHTGGDPAP